MLHADDSDSQYTYTYDSLGRVTVVDNNSTPYSPWVVLTQGYDVLSRRTSLAAKVNNTDDFKNTYKFDALNRMTRVDQEGQVGGNSVAEKRVDFAYNLTNQFTSIVRYKDTSGGGGNEVATSAFDYDTLRRLERLTHQRASTDIVTPYAWTYDDLNRVDTFVFEGDDVDYGYNENGELTSANYDTQTDESYSFDANGNRVAYTTGDNNQLLDDGTFTYTYDDEGNRLTRTRKTGTTNDHLTEYTWDHRNRLTRVAFKNNAGTLTKAVEFTYDLFNRRIGKQVDTDGDTDFDTTQRYVYDGDHIALVFNGAGSLTNRFLHGPVVDQILADDQIGNQVIWPLTDNLGTIHDLASSAGSVLNHISYDSFGKRLSETNAAVDHLFGFTGREFDEETGLQYNRARYYDSAVGRWISEDPSGFAAGDINLNRYVSNGPSNATDPSGLVGFNMSPSDVKGHDWHVGDLVNGYMGLTTITNEERVKSRVVLDGDVYRVKYDIVLEFKITLDLQEIREVSTALHEAWLQTVRDPEEVYIDPWTIERTYGHEQRHVLSVLERVREFVGSTLAGSEGKSFDDSEDAQAEADKQVRRAHEEIARILPLENLHTVYESSPKMNKVYEPYEGEFPAVTPD